MEFVSDLSLFALKTVLIAGSLVVVFALIIQMSTSRSRPRMHLEVEELNSRFRSFRRSLQSHLLEKKAFKRLVKNEKKDLKKERKQAKDSPDDKKPRIFVLDFDGDIRATHVESLREEITAVLSVASASDEIVVRLESGGGLVTAYGLAASQLARVKKAGIKLTVCVDKIAASGGYMMACVADRIVAAPFAVVGSIGVIAQVPNFNKVLKKHDIDYREVTAGEFKRTVTVFGEITPPGLEKFKEQIEGTHRLFKAFVTEHRPAIEIAKVATGEHWYGTDAKNLGLVDEIATSDELLSARYESADVYRIKFHARRKWIEKLSESASKALHSGVSKLFDDAEQRRFGV